MVDFDLSPASGVTSILSSLPQFFTSMAGASTAASKSDITDRSGENSVHQAFVKYVQDIIGKMDIEKLEGARGYFTPVRNSNI